MTAQPSLRARLNPRPKVTLHSPVVLPGGDQRAAPQRVGAAFDRLGVATALRRNQKQNDAF